MTASARARQPRRQTLQELSVDPRLGCQVTTHVRHLRHGGDG